MTNQQPPAAPPAPKPKGPPVAPPPAAPPAPTGTRTPRSVIPAPVKLDIESGVSRKKGSKILLYGTGKIGKSTAAAYLPAPLFLDVEDGTDYLNVSRIRPRTWSDLRGSLAFFSNDPPHGVQSFAIDTMTVAEILAKEHVVATRETDKGYKVDSIEGFPWGKGWQFLSDEVDGLLMDCDRLIEQGLNVCLIAHDAPTVAPNPNGEGWLRWEPDLYKGAKDERGSTRKRIKGWVDHIVFISYDVHVREGKGTGSGTRTWYTQERPTHMAGSRTVQTSAAFELSDPGAVWRRLGVVSK